MAVHTFVVLLGVFLVQLSSSRGYLLLRPAEVRPDAKSPSVKLAGTARICRRDYPNGFSIQCVGKGKYATFFVNGRRRRTARHAGKFFIGGIKNGLVKPWRYPRRRVAVACRLFSGPRFSVKIVFSCSKPPSPPRMFFTGAGVGQPSVPVVDGNLFCPQKAFGSRGWSVSCVTSDQHRVRWARFYVNKRVVRTERRKPYFIAGDYRRGNRFVVKPWKKAPRRSFLLKCELSDRSSASVRVQYGCGGGRPAPSQAGTTTTPVSTTTSATTTPVGTTLQTSTPVSTTPATIAATTTAAATTVPATTAPVTTVAKTAGAGSGGFDSAVATEGCVVIDPSKATLSNGWKKVAGGIGFNMDNNDTKIVGPDAAPLYYHFTVATTSRYGVALDMTIGGFHDYNDCWIKLTGNFQLMKNGVVSTTGKSTGWIKAFHNAKSKRAVLASTIDGNAHSIASGGILQVGQKYRFGLAGRSNKLIVHRIILFACSGTGCQRGREWAKALGRCR